MTTPTDDQLARLGATFEAFSRRYKMTESIRAEKPLNELNKQAPCFVDLAVAHPIIGVAFSQHAHDKAYTDGALRFD